MLAVAVSLVALGGVLVGFSFGLRDMYSKTMDGLGLIEGGTPAHLDIETLYYVERLMSNISSIAHTSRVTGLVMISVGILATVLACFHFQTENLVGRIRRLQPRSERLFIYMSAVGLYLAVVGAIFYSAFLLLKIMQIPSIIVQAIAVGEVVVFSVVGTIGFIRLRRLVKWLFGEGDRSIRALDCSEKDR